MEKRIDFNVDSVKVSILPTRDIMGKACALEVGELIRKLLKEKDEVNIMFASSPSQLEMLTALIDEKGIDWNRVNAFHMDEYIGLPADAPQSFGNYLKKHFFSKLTLKNVFYMDGNADDKQQECERYSALMRKFPIDITLLGIGTNGHLAFNDPRIANFFDVPMVKVNEETDDINREQQVIDGWFKSVDEIPPSAITVTIPALLCVPHIFTVVTRTTKQQIVKRTLEGKIGVECPATSIRVHNSSKLFLDGEAAGLLDIEKLKNA